MKTASFSALAGLLLLSISIGSARGSDYNYCGTSWTDANSKCGTHCPGGTNDECPNGEYCYADCTNCPAGGPTGPGPSPPTASPPTSPTGGYVPVTNPGGNDSRMIAFLGNWQSCPSLTKTEQYTHIVVSFAVSYTWSPGGNICSQSCDISAPPICNNADNQALVDAWRAQGKKVLISFGGAGMGGSWAGDPNYCWEYCFGKESHVVNQLVNIVTNQNFDGVDIDYEYFYEDNDFPTAKASSAGVSSTGQQARNFIDTVTRELKANLPAGQNTVTHAPMDADVVAGSSYYDILVNNADSGNLDYIMPQYYNGIVHPVSGGFSSGSSHYSNLVTNMFNGDPTKVVWGFCVNDCPNYNMNAASAANLMTDLAASYPCHGGAFFWVAEHDAGEGDWSSVVNGAIQPSAGCSADTPTAMPVVAPAPTNPAPTNPAPPTGAPVTSSPATAAPVTSSPVTDAPVEAPTQSGPKPTAPTNCPNTDNSGSVGGCGPTSPCADSSLCCSQWGWCGSTDDYCLPSNCCQSNCAGGGPTGPVPTTAAPVPAPTTSAPVPPPVTSAPVPAPTTSVPTRTPTLYPTTDSPTSGPTKNPITAPTTDSPTASPVTSSPTSSPTSKPTQSPATDSPTSSPTSKPTQDLAAVGESCKFGSDCRSGLCSGGKPSDRVCLVN